jgi:hypothetical protein
MSDREILILVLRDPVLVFVGKTRSFDSFVYERFCSTLLIHVGILGSSGNKQEV